MSQPLTRALSCVTIAAADPAALVRIVRDGMGWEVCAEGAIDGTLAAAWGIAAGSAGDRFTLLRSRGSDRGMIRITGGRDRWPSRPIGARWSGAEIVVMEDIDGLCDRLAAIADFKLAKRPRNADFTDAGANVHRFFYGRAPGGTHLMFTMAVTRARDYDFPAAVAPVGYIFAAPLVTAEFPRARRFYREALGMVPILEASMTEGLWHESWNLPAGTHVDLEILRGDAPGIGLGHIELQGYPASWIDPAPRSEQQFDGGSSLVTYTAVDIDAAHAAVGAWPGVKVLGDGPRPVSAPPYDGSRVFSFLAPTGERVELAERFLPAA